MKFLSAWFLTLIERHPTLGYAGAGVPTVTGFWVLLQRVTALLGFISVVIGIAVGVVTWRVQRMQQRKLEREERGVLE